MPTKVLVVEDDVLNRMFYHDVLSGSGYEVHQVDDGAQVIDEVHAFKPDIVTMDIQLPNISGLRLIRHLQRDKATREIPILAITAFAGAQEEERIRRAGAKGYLSKPVTMNKLLDAVGSCLGADSNGENCATARDSLDNSRE